jgi:hypothetical protein
MHDVERIFFVYKIIFFSGNSWRGWPRRDKANLGLVTGKDEEKDERSFFFLFKYTQTLYQGLRSGMKSTNDSIDDFY